MYHTPDMPICELSFPGDWTPLNQIFYSQCIQDSDEQRSFCSQQKKWKRKRYPYKNSKVYQKYIIYEYVSSTKSEVSTSDEFNFSENYENNTLKQSTVKYKKCTTNQNETSDEGEIFTSSNDYGSSDVSADYKVSAKKKKNQKSKNNRHLKQAAVKCKKYTAHKNESSDEEKMSSSDSSDDWEMPSSESSDGEETSFNSSEKHSNTSNDSSDSSDDYGVAEKKKKTQKAKVAVQKKKNQKAKSSQLSEYEEMVQRNRDENMALMRSLKLFEAKEEFNEAIKAEKSITNKKKQNKSREIFQNLENGLMEEVGEKTKTKADKNIKKVFRQSARLKSLLKEKEAFASSQSYNELPSVLSFQEALKKGYVYHDFISEVSGSKCQIPQHVDNDYVSHFDKMTLQVSQIVSSSSISSMVVHESKEKIIICVGNGNGEIIFWHVNSDYDFSTFQLHHQKISCLKFNPYSPNVLISSSTDGTMYRGDFERNMFYQMFKAECCHHYDFFSPTTCLVAHGIGYVSVVDIRTNGNTFEKRHKCNEDSVKTVNLHPINKTYFISAHQRGIVKLWDLRKLQNEPIIEVLCKGKSLLSSSFSPVIGNSVLVTMSDAICLLDSSSLSKEFILKESIEHNNIALCSPIQATWLPNTNDTFVIGSKLNPRRIEIFDDKLCNFFNFTNEHFNHIAVFNAFHSSLPVLASASLKRIFMFSESE